MKHETDLDVLGRISPNWNQSVHLEKKVDLKDLYFKIWNGLIDEKIVPTKSKIIYAGTETRDDYTGWNVSTDIPWHLDQYKFVQEATLKSMSKTSITNEAILT